MADSISSADRGVMRPGAATVEELAAAPARARDVIRALGPGVVVAMLWLGAGDLVDSSVAGANYGYALMWALVISLISRFLITEVVAKYMLANTTGDVTILQGYARVNRYFPLVIAGGSLVLAHFYNAFFIKGSAEALYYLTGQSFNVTTWAIVVVAAAFVLGLKGKYRHIEWIAFGSVTFLSLAFLWSLIQVGLDPVEVVRGTILFEIPPDMGAFSAIAVAISLIGAIGGGQGNLLYPYILRAKGWVRPEFRRIQMMDLAIGVAAIIVLDLAVWTVGAQVLRGSGQTVQSTTDLAQLLVSIIGPIGAVIFWIGLFGATFDNVHGFAWGYGRMVVNGFHCFWPRRGDRYGWKEERDPLYKIIGVFGFGVLPVIWSLPGMPGFVALTVFANTLTIFLYPVVGLGLLLLVNRKDLLKQGFRANKVENGLLVALIALTFWAIYQTVLALPGLWANLFKV